MLQAPHQTLDDLYFAFPRKLDDLEDTNMFDPAKINALARALGHDFSDPQLLQTALIHSSFSHENPATAAESNERLEFLGDAVLQLMITTELYVRYPKLPEGQLSKLRSFAVNAEMLSAIARNLRLQDFLRVGKGESQQLEEKDSILADGLEALIGALYLDGGPLVAQRAWLKWTTEMKIDVLDLRNLEDFDAKSRLQEFTLKTWQELPTYVYQETKLDNRPAFRVSLTIHQHPLLSTTAPSKRKAELWLARTCLQTNLHLTRGAH